MGTEANLYACPDCGGALEFSHKDDGGDRWMECQSCLIDWSVSELEQRELAGVHTCEGDPACRKCRGAVDHDAPANLHGWDRECVLCGHTWIEEFGGVECPKCHDRGAGRVRQSSLSACDCTGCSDGSQCDNRDFDVPTYPGVPGTSRFVQQEAFEGCDVRGKRYWRFDPCGDCGDPNCTDGDSVDVTAEVERLRNLVAMYEGRTQS